MNSKIKDLSLASEGRKKIEYTKQKMPVIKALLEELYPTKPLEGIKIGACLHVTDETAVLLEALKEAGADIYLCGSNPLSTKDEIAAALVEKGINVYAWSGQSEDEYFSCIDEVAKNYPNITIDDGADLTIYIHEQYPELAEKIIGGTEETTTGITRLKNLSKSKKLKYPIIAVNNAESKTLLDNVFGTGQSTIDGILRATNTLLAGKNFVVCGYGYCGRGLAKRAKGMGCRVIITEVDPIKALEAFYEGYEVMPIEEAAKIGDIFVTVTGNKSVIREEHFKLMKDGAILANSGHFDVEIDIKDLEKISMKKETIRENLEEYTLENGKKLYLIARGRLVNLVAAEGHPPEVMQSSFANQFLSVLYLVERKGKLKNTIYKVPKYIDEKVALLTLNSYGIKIDYLTKEQKRYLRSYKIS